MGFFPSRVVNQIMEQPTYYLPQNKGASNDKALDANAPTVRGDAMGKIPDTGLLSLRVAGLDTNPSDITIWFFDEGPEETGGQVWWKGGANSTQYKKEYEEGCGDAFNAPPGALYFLTAEDEIETCKVCHIPLSE